MLPTLPPRPPRRTGPGLYPRRAEDTQGHQGARSQAFQVSYILSHGKRDENCASPLLLTTARRCHPQAANILLSPDGKARLADFGVSGQIARTFGATKRNTFTGAPQAQPRFTPSTCRNAAPAKSRQLPLAEHALPSVTRHAVLDGARGDRCLSEEGQRGRQRGVQREGRPVEPGHHSPGDGDGRAPPFRASASPRSLLFVFLPFVPPGLC